MPDDKSKLFIKTNSVSVTASNDCGSNSSAMYAYVPPTPTFTTSTTDVSCFGGSDGIISINVTQGTPGYSYTIDGAATSADISGLAAGDYVIGVTDAYGCSAEDATVTVSEPTPLEAWHLYSPASSKSTCLIIRCLS